MFIHDTRGKPFNLWNGISLTKVNTTKYTLYLNFRYFVYTS